MRDRRSVPAVDVRDSAGVVEVGTRRDGDVGGGDDVPSAVGRKQEDVGQPRTEHRRRERHGAADGAVGQSWQQFSAGGVVAQPIDGGRCQDSRQEGSGRTRAPELFEHDRQLGQSVARAADVLGKM